MTRYGESFTPGEDERKPFVCKDCRQSRCCDCTRKDCECQCRKDGAV